MKIIDRERDFYDYLSTQYGVDNRLVYVREKKIELDSIKGIEGQLVEKIRGLNTYSHWYLNSGPRWGGNPNPPEHADKISHYWLVICEHVIPVETIKPPERFVTGKDYFTGELVNKTRVQGLLEKWSSGDYWGVDVKAFIDEGMTIAKKVGEPVFMFKPDRYHAHDSSGIKIENICVPKLRNIAGLNEYVDAQQVFQKIEMFIGEKRDTMPEPVVPNDIKILQAGFDLKQSFRKRK